MTETLSKSFVCNGAFGLGVTSCADFVRNVMVYKTVKSVGVAYMNPNTVAYNTRAGLVVFDGLRQLSRFATRVQPHQTIVVSEIVTLLKEVVGIEPLDYLNARSFEFNFVQVDLTKVVRALRRKSQNVSVGFINRDSLGFHIDVAAKPDEFVSAFMSIMSSLPFQYRQRLRLALTTFFRGDVATYPTVITTVNAMKDMALGKEIVTFARLFTTDHAKYHAAVNSDKSAEWVAKNLDVNAYTVMFLRKMTRDTTITVEKVTAHDKAPADT